MEEEGGEESGKHCLLDMGVVLPVPDLHKMEPINAPLREGRGS